MNTAKHYITVLIVMLVLPLAAQKEDPRELIKKLQQTPNSTERVDLLDKLSIALKNSDFKKAMDYAIEEIALSKQLKYTKGIGLGNFRAGDLYLRRGKLDKAKEHFL